SFTLAAQPGDQLGFQLTFGLDVDRLIDRFVRHPPLWIITMVHTQPTSDRLRRPTFLEEQPAHLIPQPRPFLEPTWLRASRLLISALLGTERPIRRPAPI